VLPKELFTDASLKKPMPFSAKPSPEVQLIAHELALLRGLAADRRQASWLAAVHDRDLKSLLKAERGARGRYEQLRGYPPDEQAKALALWQEATEAVREYRSKVY